MIENIRLTGISDELIDKMIDAIGYGYVLDMACNYELVKENIEFLKNLGIQTVEELLLNRPNVFLIQTNVLQKKFSNTDISFMCNLINEDCLAVDEVIS